MKPPRCDVIGCQQPALFVRVVDGPPLLDDYLCDSCYERLQIRLPNFWLYYRPIREARPMPVLHGRDDSAGRAKV